MSPLQSMRRPVAPVLGVNKHPSQMLKPPGKDFFVEIDDKMVEIIQILWSKGYVTQFSCEDLSGSGRAQIIFETMTETIELLEKLMEIDDRLGWRTYLVRPMMAMDGGKLRAELTWRVKEHDEVLKAMRKL